MEHEQFLGVSPQKHSETQYPGVQPSSRCRHPEGKPLLLLFLNCTFLSIQASQNAKINSEYFEQICSISTEKQWDYLQESQLPLHEWENHIRKTLIKEAHLLK